MFGSHNCPTCQSNKAFPSHRRPKCPHHPHTEIHHHHHYNPPTAPPASSYYPPPGNYYPPPAGGYYPPPGTTTSYSWVQSSLGQPMPPNAVLGGRDADGQTIYVGRAQHERDLIPAKVIPGRRCCYVAYNGKEHSKSSYQVLCDTRAEWVPGSRGSVHPDAVEGGRTESGETLYIGRAFHRNSQTVGKIHPSHGTCYISFGGQEIGNPNYEILISRRY